MDFLGNISTNLVAAAIGAAAVAFWHIVVRWRRFRGPRKFWEPFISGNCVCVTGNLSAELLSETFLRKLEEFVQSGTELQARDLLQQHIRDQEHSGLMGRGDHDAVVQVQAGLARTGLQSTVPERIGRLSSEDLRKNLIVVGGPDLNPTTNTLLEQLPCKLIVTRNGQDENVVRDLVHDKDYSPGIGSDGRRRDYGILVRARNPKDPTKAVLIIAGAHGFGSLAAAEMAFSSEVELHQEQHAFDSGFEGLVCHEREDDHENSFSRSSLILIRPLLNSKH